MLRGKNLGGSFGGIFKAPKTILGFFVIVIGILGLTIYNLTVIFSENDPLQFMIPWIVLFSGVVFVLVCVGIFVTAWINPEKLMLGEVRGEVYLQMLQIKQGDSDKGEFVEETPVSTVALGQATVDQAVALPRKLEDDSND